MWVRRRLGTQEYVQAEDSASWYGPLQGAFIYFDQELAELAVAESAQGMDEDEEEEVVEVELRVLEEGAGDKVVECLPPNEPAQFQGRLGRRPLHSERVKQVLLSNLRCLLLAPFKWNTRQPGVTRTLFRETEIDK